MLFKVDQHFYLIIVSVENTASHQYIAQNGENMFRAISEIVGNYISNCKPKFLTLKKMHLRSLFSVIKTLYLFKDFTFIYVYTYIHVCL